MDRRPRWRRPSSRRTTSAAISAGWVGRCGFCDLCAMPPVGAMVTITLRFDMGISPVNSALLFLAAVAPAVIATTFEIRVYEPQPQERSMPHTRPSERQHGVPLSIPELLQRSVLVSRAGRGGAGARAGRHARAVGGRRRRALPPRRHAAALVRHARRPAQVVDHLRRRPLRHLRRPVGRQLVRRGHAAARHAALGRHHRAARRAAWRCCRSTPSSGCIARR